ncbi:MAG: carboxypeptidase regulatory-like domain-containing protein [Candidatus Marinimicrobia bacterium]|jgi:hypothetical protein|nr:carboxypeptidase regulatory-like domain-containing protein [Candidatus Neomarinimicrobiota bacterium]MBT3576745.1 carboxypeptidase regulatory-like domain-containing protein [Candidatus Neomarinimicrobiota bacterium]MBT3678953.1 carboxypeptidase regulatory-like domain-containing protein [Candidatus Neomarinimicrobiota bacterium]MBT3950210.1 carboxypeptidase regulatory-like domain-containing protein [Candidatus Neomarinimicrobiota bacterium]MBT4252176.1 carboxypeptidase regulatory-like domain-
MNSPRLPSIFILLTTLVLIACDDPNKGHPPPYHLTGILQGDGYILQSSVIDGASIDLFMNDSLITSSISDSAGQFRFDGLITAQYQLVISKLLPYNNSICDTLSVSVFDDDVDLKIFRVAHVEKDYFPLHVGNTWTYQSKSERSPGAGGDISETWSILTLEILSKTIDINGATYQSRYTNEQYRRVITREWGDTLLVDDQPYTSVDSIDIIESEGAISGIFNGFHVYQNQESAPAFSRVTYSDSILFFDETLRSFLLREQETMEDESYTTLIENIGPVSKYSSQGMGGWSVTSRILIEWSLN